MSADARLRRRWREVLKQSRAEIEWYVQEPTARTRVIGLKDVDANLNRVGREWLRSNDASGPTAAPPVQFEPGPDVYLASRLYAEGGHTALMGDFVRALHRGQDERPPYLILTEHPTPKLSAEIVQRIGVPEDNVRFTEGKTPDARLDDLFRTLLTLRPGRLFLFHHPEDPLPGALSQPEIARQIFLVHHSDAQASSAVYLPGLRVIDLHPRGAAITRLHGVPSDLLLLTCPDPGPRPVGFLTAKGLTTASCGSPHKFDREYLYEYPETIALLLQTTGGRHFHIGPVYDRFRERIQSALSEAAVPPDRFIYIPWVPSLGRALWECQCDVYFSSFPIDGARVNVEVAASATPHLRHGRHRRAHERPYAMDLQGSLVWHTWQDLVGILHDLTDRTNLEQLSAKIRQSYETLHHPAVFERTLQSIVSGEGGMVDPDADEREWHQAKASMTATPALLKLIKQLHAHHPREGMLHRIGSRLRSRLSR